MAEGEPIDRLAEVRARVERSAFHAWAAMRLDRVAPGKVDVSLDAEPHHLNLVGIVHGGMIATLATGLAYRTMLEPGSTHVTSQLSVTFLAPGRSGRIRARGRVLKAGRRFGYAEADVVDDTGALLARAAATFTVMQERPTDEPQ